MRIQLLCNMLFRRTGRPMTAAEVLDLPLIISLQPGDVLIGWCQDHRRRAWQLYRTPEGLCRGLVTGSLDDLNQYHTQD